MTAWLVTSPEARALNGTWIEAQPKCRELGLLPDWDSRMAFDLVIRNGTVVDGSGLGSYRADVGDRRRPHRRRRADPRAGRRGDRRRGPRRHARLHRRPHPHGRPGVLGPARARNSCWHGVTTVVMGNCGFTLAPVRADAARAGGPQPRAGRGHRPGGAGRRHRLELGDVPRVPRRRRPRSRRASTTPPTSATRRCARGSWASGRSTEAATDDDLAAMERELEAALARRRHRLHHLAQRAPRDVRRPPGRVAPRVVGRGVRLVGVDGRRSAPASSRAAEAACSPPTPSGASEASSRMRDARRREPACRSPSASSPTDPGGRRRCSTSSTTPRPPAGA